MIQWRGREANVKVVAPEVALVAPEQEEEEERVEEDERKKEVRKCTSRHVLVLARDRSASSL